MISVLSPFPIIAGFYLPTHKYHLYIHWFSLSCNTQSNYFYGSPVVYSPSHHFLDHVDVNVTPDKRKVILQQEKALLLLVKVSGTKA